MTKQMKMAPNTPCGADDCGVDDWGTDDWAEQHAPSYRALFDEAPIPYHEIDERGVIRRVNRAECALLGYTREEMVGRPVWTFQAGDLQEISRRAITRKLAGKEPLDVCRRHFITKDSQLVTVEVYGRLIVNAKGVAVGIRTAMIDVTGRDKMELELLESQRWLGTTLHSLREGVVAVDPLGIVKFMNQSAEALTGWTEREATDSDLCDVVDFRLSSRADGDAGEALMVLFSNSLSQSRAADGTIVARNGFQQAVELTLSPIIVENDMVSGVVVVLRRAV